MHIISHYKGYSVSGLCKHLRTFFNKHINWVAQVGKTVLSKKHLAVKDYANSLSEGEIPVDPLGLLCIARNWHIHICVFLKKGVWTTRHDNSLENVRIYLLYTGGFTFFDTAIQRRALSPIFTPSDNENNGENLSNQKSTLDSDAGSQGTGTKSGDEGGTKSSGTKSGLASTGKKSGLGSTHTKQTHCKRKRASTVRRKPRKPSKPKPKQKQKPAQPKPPKPRPSTAHNTRSSLQPLISVDNILDNKNRSAKPDKLSEVDPILDAFKSVNDQTDLELLLSDDSKKRKSSCVGEENLDTNDGVVKVKEYALKRPKKN